MDSLRCAVWFAAVILALWPLGAAAGDDAARESPRGVRACWPGYRGPNHDGTSDEVVKLGDDAPRLLWQQKIATGVSSCAVVGNRLWTQGGRGKSYTVYALDTADGDILWQRRLTASPGNVIVIKGTKASGKNRKEVEHEEKVYGMGLVCGTPCFSDGKVYTYGVSADLHCLSADTGEIIWHRALMADLPARSHHYGYCCSPMVVNGLVIVPISLATPPKGAFRGEDEGLVIRGGIVMAFDAETGKEVWRNEMGACGWSTSTFAQLDGRDTIIHYSGTLVVGMDPKTGKTLWHYDPLAAGLCLKGKEAAEVGAGATVVGSRVLFPSHAYRTTICIEVADGRAEHKWTTDAGNHFLNGAVHDGVWVTAACGKGGKTRDTLYGIDIQTGEVLWTEALRRREDTRRRSGCRGDGLMIAGDTLALITSSGEVILGRVSRKGLERLACIEIENRKKHASAGHGLHTPPVLTGNRLYVRVGENIYAYSTEGKTRTSETGLD